MPLPYIPFDPNTQIDQRPVATSIPSPADPLGLGAEALANLESELNRELPSAQALCRAADVLLIEGRAQSAVELLFWGTLRYPAGGESDADHRLLKMRQANALQHQDDKDSLVRSLNLVGDAAMEDPEEIRTVRTATLLALCQVEKDKETLEQLCDHVEKKLPRNPRAEFDHCFLAMVRSAMGKPAAAARHLAELRDDELRFDALIFMDRRDDAFNVINAALDRGDTVLLARLWRSPFHKRLSSLSRFDSWVERCGARQLRSGNVRLNVPGRLLYGGALTANRACTMESARNDVAKLQSRLDSGQEAPFDLFEVAEHLQHRRESLPQAETLLRWAIQRCPKRAERTHLQTRLCHVYLQMGRPHDALAVGCHLPRTGRAFHFNLLAIWQRNTTPEQHLKLLEEVNTAIDAPAAIPEDEHARYDRDLLRAIKVAVLHSLGRDDAATSTLCEISSLPARSTALLLTGKKHEAMGVLHEICDLALTQAAGRYEYAGRVWNCPNIFELQDEPGFGSFALTTGIAELCSGELTFNLPAALRAPPPAVDTAPGVQPVYGFQPHPDGSATYHFTAVDR